VLLVFGGFLRGLLVLLLLLLVLRGLLIGLLVLRGFLPRLFLRGFVVPQEVRRLLQYEQNEHDDDQNADHPHQTSQRPCSRFRLLRRAPSSAYCINFGKRQCPRVLAQRVNAPGVARVGAPVLLTLSADVPGSYGPALFTSAILFLSTVYLLILKPPGPPP
jgi:hypothetical protein